MSETVANERFRMGDRVRLTQLALRNGVAPRSAKDRKGIVTGFSYDKRLVLVRMDGNKCATRYHPDFWERTR